MTTDPITTIRARHAATAAKINKLRPQLVAMERELQEYETALKVLEQVAISAAQGNASGPSGAVARSDGEPTMPDLILRSLSDGPKPIADVTAAVTSMSDKPVEANNVRSTTWRMWKAGRIEKTGDNYHLIGHAPECQTDDFEDLL